MQVNRPTDCMRLRARHVPSVTQQPSASAAAVASASACCVAAVEAAHAVGTNVRWHDWRGGRLRDLPWRAASGRFQRPGKTNSRSSTAHCAASRWSAARCLIDFEIDSHVPFSTSSNDGVRKSFLALPSRALRLRQLLGKHSAGETNHRALYRWLGHRFGAPIPQSTTSWSGSLLVRTH
eukprot:COSAG06_NODE_13604_length_1240_cov_1.446976_1_plen_179_part_00